MNDDDFSAEEESTQTTVDTAHGSVHFFKYQRLQPFSFDRQMAFERIRGDGFSNIEAATCMVFLCLSEWDVIDRARGQGVAEFRRKMSEWAQSQGIGAWSPEGQECLKVAAAILREIDVSQFKSEKPGEGGNDSGLPSGPTTSTKSRKSSVGRSRRSK